MFWNKPQIEVVQEVQSKQEYKARTFDLREVKSAWAKAVNNKDNHPYKDEKYGNKIRGKIYSVHYLVYNLLRQMPAERGFEPVGQGYEEAKCWLTFLLKYKPEQLLYPFDGTVTIEQLKELL